MKSAFDLGGISFCRETDLSCASSHVICGKATLLSFGLFGGHLGIVCILRGGVQSLGI